MAKRKPKPKSQPDYIFMILIGILVLFGLVMLASASSDLAKFEFNNSYFYISHQLLFGVLVGIIGFITGSLVYYQKWKDWALWLLLGNIFLLMLVFTPLGFATKGAARWLDIGGISIQPGELIKITFIIYISSWLVKSKKRKKSFMQGLLPFGVLVGSVVLLLLLQPATTTAIIIFGSALGVYFLSGAKFKFIAGMLLVALVGVSILIYATPYRMERVTTFFNPDQDELDSGYHINQSLIAIGSGGLTGVGYGQSTTKLNYLPEPIGDSIFAVIAEELGFVGSISLLLLFLAVILRGIQIARGSPDEFGRLIVVGFVVLIGAQTFINIAAISGVMPLTGIPLPFISYGGTAMAVFLTMSGIIVNVSRYIKS